MPSIAAREHFSIYNFKPFFAVFLTLFITASTGCGQKTLESISLSPEPVDMPMGLSQQFKAIGHYSNGSTQTLTPTGWSSSVPAIADISDSGLVTAQRMGTTSISVVFNDITSQIPINVVNTVLQSIKVSPDATTAAIGSSVQLKATGHYTDGSEREHVVDRASANDYVWMDAPSWSSSDETVATVNATGLVSIKKPTGSAIITASIGKIKGHGEVLAEGASGDAALLSSPIK